MRPVFWKRFSRCVCLCLCVVMLETAVGEEVILPAADWMVALPTPTPVPTDLPDPTEDAAGLMSESEGEAEQEPVVEEKSVEEPQPAPEQTPPATEAPTQAPAEAPTEAPTQAPTEEPTPEPSPTPDAPAQDEPSPEPSAEPSPEPTEEPSPAPSGEPEPSVEPSATPSVEPEPSVEPSPSPSATPEDGHPTPAPTWDESQCDHTTPNCLQAPKCDLPDCAHIGVDNRGDVVGLCPLGMWMLSAVDKAEANPTPKPGNGGISLMDASAPVTLILRGGENTIYRSGTYLVTGGAENASLYVRGGLSVSLELENAQLLTLKAAAGAKVTLGFTGRSAMETLAAKGATVVFLGEGSLTVKTNLNCDALTVRSGSVRLPEGAQSSNGYTCHPFLAPGALSACLDGEPLCNVSSDTEGYVYLWLPALAEGAYEGRLEDNILYVTSAPSAPHTAQEYDISSGAAFAPEANASCRLFASDAARQSADLRVDAEGVSLTLDGVGSDASRPSLTAAAALKLYLQGENALNALNASAPVTLSGTGLFRIDTLNVPALNASAGLTLAVGTAQALPEGWQPIAVSDLPDGAVTAERGGQRLPVLLTGGRMYAPLAAPAAGKTWAATRQDNVLLVEEVDAQTQVTALTDAGLSLADGSARLASQGECAGTLEVAANAKLTLTLAGLHTSGALRIGSGARVTLAAEGANAVGRIELAQGARLTVQGAGALLAGAVAGESGAVISVDAQTNLSLADGDKLPGNSRKPVVLYITDENGDPMLSRAITLKLGKDAPFAACTAADGRVTLWQAEAPDGMSAVVMEGGNTYADILLDGKAWPDALPEIRDVRVNNASAVVFSADKANTLGVMYKVAKAEAELPDTWVSGAKVAWMKNGECNIPGLKNGDVVTFRPIAARGEKAPLSAKTADAFAFGEKQTFTAKGVRVAFSLPMQRKTYDRKPLTLNASQCPKGSTITYYQSGRKLSGPPVEVGSYVARVSVPAGNDTYLPGNYDVQMRIDRIRVLVSPWAATKQKGEPDPVFGYDYDESVMFYGDEVTGPLTRVAGEAYGNYAFLTDRLQAPNYYSLEIDSDAPAFFVDWNIHHYLPYDPLARIDPVYDELRFSDGDTLSTQLRTGELLQVGDRYYGRLVTDIEDGDVRPAAATLRMRAGYDSALLILTADAEMNEDGGYQTDADGNRVLRGRRLTLSFSTINGLLKQRVDAIAFSLDGVTVQLPLDTLSDNDEMTRWMRENGVARTGSAFQVDLEPIHAADALSEQESAAADALALGDRLMRVSVWAQNGEKRVDVSGYLEGARVSFDASPLLEDALARETAGMDETLTINGQVIPVVETPEQQRIRAAVAGAVGEEEATVEGMELALEMLNEQLTLSGAGLVCYTNGATPLSAVAVVPYTQSETRVAAYGALMRTRPYMTTAFARGGLYSLRSQATEQSW